MSKKTTITVILGLIIIFILAVRIMGGGEKDKQITITPEDGASAENLIDRAHVAKMVALLGFSYDDMTGIELPTTYSDIGEGKWYDRYFAASCKMGVVWGSGTCRPADYLTYDECESILRSIYGGAEDVITSNISSIRNNKRGTDEASGGGIVKNDGKSGSDYISSEEWLILYGKMINGEFGVQHRQVKAENLMLLSIIENTESSWQVATSGGAYHFDGYALDAYTNGTINALTDGNDIIYINGFSNEPCTINNAWVSSCDESKVEMYYAGVVTSMSYTPGVITDYAALNGNVADIVVEGGSITSITPKADRRNDKILSMNDSVVETATYGRIMISPECKVYGVYDNIKTMTLGSVPIGYNVTDIVIDSNASVCAMIITAKVTPASIRVAIKTSGFKEQYHDSIVLNSDMGMTLMQNGAAYEVAPGQKIEYKKDGMELQNGRITVVPAAGGHIILENVKRGYNRPAYRGVIELALYNEGIVAVNELSIDEYLYAVVPSEMPVSYGVEALKVQAICARSYAYIHVMDGRLAGIGAHVDDSTSYQVYNNTAETAESIEAVNATSGQVLTYNGNIIPAYYYSTSCGMTAKGNDVWFGMKDTPYLISKLQSLEMDIQSTGLDLTNDEHFSAFLDREDIATFDSSFPWYRWQTDITAADIRKSVDASLEKRYKINPSLILTKSDSGEYVSQQISTVGDIKSITTLTRSEGGIVTSVIIKGSERTIKVKSEYNIRLLLAPLKSKISRKDGSVVDGMSLLPSAFIVISSEGKGKNKVFHIKGGGYGHGVGMSQNGVRTMVQAGYGYKDILGHYYNGCEISYN